MSTTWPSWIGRFRRFRVLAGVAMKSFLRLVAASLFIGQFGHHIAMAKPPRVVPSGLFSSTADDSESIITLLDPRDSDSSILLISGQPRTHRLPDGAGWPDLTRSRKTAVSLESGKTPPRTCRWTRR